MGRKKIILRCAENLAKWSIDFLMRCIVLHLLTVLAMPVQLSITHSTKVAGVRSGNAPTAFGDTAWQKIKENLTEKNRGEAKRTNIDTQPWGADVMVV